MCSRRNTKGASEMKTKKLEERKHFVEATTDVQIAQLYTQCCAAAVCIQVCVCVCVSYVIVPWYCIG